MHPDDAFAWTDRDGMLAFLARQSFSTLFAMMGDRAVIAHAPVILCGDTLRFHLSRRNELANLDDGAPVALSCVGPEAYISPDWYGSDNQVPTWNYLAVECKGRVRRLGPADLPDMLDALGAVHEARLHPKPPWTRAKMDSGRFEALLRGIVGFEMDIESLRGTRKIGQNKTNAERARVATALDSVQNSDMATLMRRDM